MKFKRGDIIIGTDSKRYNITTDKCILQVTNNENDITFECKVLLHFEGHASLGKYYDNLDVNYFRLATNQELIKAGLSLKEEIINDYSIF